MRYRPSLRSIWTLIVLALVCYGLYLWAESSRVTHKMPYYEPKLAAARLMDKSLRALADLRSESEGSESFGDPRLDMLIGQQFSLITTDFSSLEDKIAGANPNYAALALELLARAGVRQGDPVAIGFTGSQPGVNIAVLCACEILGARPVTITAVGSTWWGANDPDFTWLDMERFLNDEGLVHSQPVAASLGGGLDDASGISQVGKALLRTAIERNSVPLIAAAGVTESSARRFQVYRESLPPGMSYRAYINVGEGIASLGHAENAALIRDGLIRRLPVRNYPARGVIHQMNAQGVPVINLTDIRQTSRRFELGGAQVPLPEIGDGPIFVSERYNVTIAGLATVLALAIILVILRLDQKLFQLKETGVDPETLL